jgi:hypothetical protein
MHFLVVLLNTSDVPLAKLGKMGMKHVMAPSHAGALRSQQQQEENKMNRKVIRQAVVGSILGALLCVALLLGVLLLLASIAGTHPSQTGIMLIASSSHLA